MEKLREAVIASASSKLNTELSSSQIALIDQRLHESFPHGLRVPSHPTYATMVLKAIAEMSEKDGSTEDSISEYIMANNDDLPWAHKSILNHHLRKLCGDGLIVLTANNKYLTYAATPKRGRKKGKYKRKKVMVKKGVMSQRNSGKDLNSCVTEVLEEHKFVCEENQDSIGFDNQGPENVEKGCMKMVVFEQKVAETGQQAQVVELVEKESSLIPKLSIPDLVKSRTRKTQTKCDQLLTGGSEVEASVDECQEKMRNGNLALQDHSSGEEWKNSSSSLESTVKKKKFEVDLEVREVVFAIANPLPTAIKSGLRVSRQLSNSKEQQNKLILSHPNKFPSPELQKENSTSSRQDSPVDHDIDCPIAKKLVKPKEKGRPHIRFKMKNQNILQELLTRSSQETKSKWPSWIPTLLHTDFNVQCKVHANTVHMCNSYCSDCNNGALCSSCVASHEGHRVIKIREVDFEQSVDISDIGMLDLSGIRITRESSTKETIVLKRGLASPHTVPANNACLFCKSRVPFPFKFCTLKCKFQHEVQAG